VSAGYFAGSVFKRAVLACLGSQTHQCVPLIRNGQNHGLCAWQCQQHISTSFDEKKLVKTEADYAVALARIDKLMDAKPGAPQGEELEILSLLIHEYEGRVLPIDKPDPVAAIRFRMAQQGLTNKDLVPFLGSRSRVSEVLSGRRSLSLKMIRALVRGLLIPAYVLLGEVQHA
jgi:antitoxin component HigA of HigAB toxin-antitoxin module